MSVLEAVWWTWVGAWSAGSLAALADCAWQLRRLGRLHRSWTAEAGDALSPPEGAQSVVAASTGEAGVDDMARPPGGAGTNRR